MTFSELLCSKERLVLIKKLTRGNPLSQSGFTCTKSTMKPQWVSFKLPTKVFDLFICILIQKNAMTRTYSGHYIFFFEKDDGRMQ